MNGHPLDIRQRMRLDNKSRVVCWLMLPVSAGDREKREIRLPGSEQVFEVRKGQSQKLGDRSGVQHGASFHRIAAEDHIHGPSIRVEFHFQNVCGRGATAAIVFCPARSAVRPMGGGISGGNAGRGRRHEAAGHRLQVQHIHRGGAQTGANIELIPWTTSGAAEMG